jgi:hypothetical protein
MTPLICRLVGHAWANDQPGAAIVYGHGEPCVRRGCPARRRSTATPPPLVLTPVGWVAMQGDLGADQIADQIHEERFHRDQSPSTPDTFYAGMRHAEKIARRRS